MPPRDSVTVLTARPYVPIAYPPRCLPLAGVFPLGCERYLTEGRTSMTTYSAIFESAADGGVWGWIPEIPGATGMGQTIEEAEANLRAGLEAWIETERSVGREVPSPSIIGTRTVSTGAA